MSCDEHQLEVTHFHVPPGPPKSPPKPEYKHGMVCGIIYRQIFTTNPKAEHNSVAKKPRRCLSYAPLFLIILQG